MKILIAFDSFKGSLTSIKAGELLKQGIQKSNSEAMCEVISVADGGEGSLEMIKTNKQKHTFTALNPLGKLVDGYFLSSENTAYIEMATTAGLTLLHKEERNPLKTNTYGLGEQILLASKKGFKRIVIFAGGSATNDAGLGALQALGFRFYSKTEEEIIPNGESLVHIHHFMSPNSKTVPEIIVATDVTNPFYGPNGATYVYSTQKGATQEMLPILEEGIKNIAGFFPKKEINQLKGSGAAGGLAGGFHLFLGAKVTSATDLLFKHINLKNKINEADLVITGEGRLDSQSKNGKLVSRILHLCKPKKCIILAGEVEEDLVLEKALYISSLKTHSMNTDEAMRDAESLMIQKGEEMGNFIKNKFA